MRYRPEVDGLRAVAVLPVIAFHAGAEVLPGGFVGVDVFFVISGYLITALLLEDLRQGQFSLVRFYERRARRILPALFVVMLCCLIPAWVWLVPADLEDFGESVIAVSLSLSNFLFWHESGYFERAAELKPLLHTWSLAVEEQYYLLFPLLLAWLWRRASPTSPLHRVRHSLLWIAAISLIAGIAASWLAPVSAFYLLPFRAWELLAGALLAVREAQRVAQNPDSAMAPGGRAALGYLGLGMVVLAMLTLDRDDPFPGLAALLPVIGTVLLLEGTRSPGPLVRLLCWKPLVGIGLISYSAYLWHQPLFAFARHWLQAEPSPVLYWGLSLLALGLAALSWRYVETPWRSPAGFSRRSVFRAALGGTLVFIVLGWMLDRGDGWPQRMQRSPDLPKGDVGHLEFHQFIADRYPVCEPRSLARSALEWQNYLRCMQSRSDRPPSLALVGDSHAEHWFIGLAEALPDENVVFHIRDAEPGASVYQEIIRYLEDSDSIHTVVLSWYYLDRIRRSEAPENFWKGLEQVLSRLGAAGKSLVLLADLPAFGFGAESCVLVLRPNWEARCTQPAERFLQSQSMVNQRLQTLAESHGAEWINLADRLCDRDHCSMTEGNTVLYRDDDHLNIPGSRKMGSALVRRSTVLSNLISK